MTEPENATLQPQPPSPEPQAGRIQLHSRGEDPRGDGFGQARIAQRLGADAAQLIGAQQIRPPAAIAGAGRGGSEVVVKTTAARGLARLAGRLEGLALLIPIGIGHLGQLIKQPQHPEGTEVGGHRGAGLAALHIGHGEAAHAHPLGHVLQPPAAPQPGGADVAPQPLQGQLQGRRGVLNDGTELSQGCRNTKGTLRDASLSS